MEDLATDGVTKRTVYFAFPVLPAGNCTWEVYQHPQPLSSLEFY